MNSVIWLTGSNLKVFLRILKVIDKFVLLGFRVFATYS